MNFKNGVKEVIDKVLLADNLENLQTGRSKNETKEILNLMMRAMLNHKKMDTDRFFDEVIIYRHFKNTRYSFLLTFRFLFNQKLFYQTAYLRVI